jgi:hypothetical protein
VRLQRDGFVLHVLLGEVAATVPVSRATPKEPLEKPSDY